MARFLVEFSIEGPCPLVSLTSRHPETRIQYVDAVQAGRGCLEVFEVQGDADGFMDDVAGMGDGARVLDLHGTRRTGQVRVGGRCIRTWLLEHGCLPIEVHAEGGRETVTVSAPSGEVARSLVQGLREAYPSFRLHRVRQGDAVRPGDGLDAFGLTDAQEDALRAALDGGYFETVRKRTGVELAQELGVDRSTFSRNLRSALRKVVGGLVQ